MKSFVYLCAASGAMIAFASGAAAVSPFFTETFENAGDLGGFGGGGGTVGTNPGTGGVDGAADGFLQMERSFAGSFGLRNLDPEFNGDYIAAGVTGVSLYLKDIGTDEDWDLHVGVGTQFNFYLYNESFNPSSIQWEQFFVDMTDETKWTQIGIIGGTFNDALMTANRFLIRHDNMPFGAIPVGPVAMMGDVGVDNISFVPSPGALALFGMAGAFGARRRR